MLKSIPDPNNPGETTTPPFPGETTTPPFRGETTTPPFRGELWSDYERRGCRR